MAGDWIKFRKKLLTDGRVLQMADTLGCKLSEALLGLLRLWCLADDHAEDDGTLRGYSQARLDEMLGLTGFCGALPPDWFQVQDGKVLLPNYTAHNGATAKRRATDASAKQRQRVGKLSAPLLDQRREEKSREENTNPLTPLPMLPQQFDCPEFIAAWALWAQHRRDKKNPLTPGAVKLAAKDLRLWGVKESVRVIEHCVSMGYRGLFRPDAWGALPKAAPAKGETMVEKIRRESAEARSAWDGRTMARLSDSLAAAPEAEHE